ncbi:MAG: DUF4093 domain-containing protein [Clostridia bacterium]|nr:DUF4093 domain-containing protein [Clostridia bacterium]
MKKLYIKYPILVEGKYDRLALLNVVEGQILTTEGFGIFKNKEKLALLRALAEKTPIIVLTDPDGAGKLIRSHIVSALPKERIIPLYVPQISGKEKRKQAPSAAGYLGVEGQDSDLLYRLLAPFAAEQPTERQTFTKAMLYADGLTGSADCAARRAKLAAAFGLPGDMTPNALLAALSIVATHEEYRAAITRLFGEGEK